MYLDDGKGASGEMVFTQTTRSRRMARWCVVAVTKALLLAALALAQAGEISASSGVRATAVSAKSSGTAERTLQERRKARREICRASRPCFYVVVVRYSGEWTETTTRVADGRVIRRRTLSTKSIGVSSGAAKAFWQRRRMNVAMTGGGAVDGRILESTTRLLFDWTPAPGEPPVDRPCIENNTIALDAPIETLAGLAFVRSGRRTLFAARFSPGYGMLVEPEVICSGPTNSRLGVQISDDPTLYVFPELRGRAAAPGDVGLGRRATPTAEPGNRLAPLFRLKKRTFRRGKKRTLQKIGRWSPPDWLSPDGKTRGTRTVRERWTFTFLPCPGQGEQACELQRPLL